jgi:hypothetical protein
MTVYVDDMRRVATVGSVRGTWSHLVADSHPELMDMAARLGLDPRWIQHEGTVREHFDVTERHRARAVAAGAVEISYLQDLAAVIQRKRAAQPSAIDAATACPDPGSARGVNHAQQSEMPRTVGSGTGQKFSPLASIETKRVYDVPGPSQGPNTRRVGRTATAAPTRPPSAVLVWEDAVVWTCQSGPIPAGATPPVGVPRDVVASWTAWQAVDLRCNDLPDGWAADGLVGLVERNITAAQRRGERRRTLMLDGPALRRLGLPAPDGDTPPPPAGFREHPAVAALAESWAKVWTSHGWITAERGTGRTAATVTVGLMPWLLRERRYPLLAPRDAGTTALGMWHWERLTGTPWTTTPGGVASQIVRDAHPYRRDAPGPWWGHERPAAGTEPAAPPPWATATEHPITLTGWARPAPAGTVVRCWDGRRAYLASWTTARVAAGKLTPRGALPFDPSLAGWWLVELAPWTDQRMPHPAGVPADLVAADGTAQLWMTTPGLELLAQLAEDGTYGGCEVLDAWVGPKADVLGAPARVLDAVWRAADTEARGNVAGQADPAARLARSVKGVYTAGYGQWVTERSQIRRPDWAEAVIAQGRATTWRKAWRVGHHEDRWPLGFETDAIFYAVDPDDQGDVPWPGEGRIRGIKIGAGLGEFQIKGQPIPAQKWNEDHA